MNDGEVYGETSPGAVIGDRYVLEELVGRGGMADVYRARDRRLDRPVAVKIFRPGGDPEGARRLAAEARLLAPLDHPGVVSLSDGGVDESRPFLVMPLLPGGTLADRLASGPLAVAEVARLGRELAGTLAYLHGRGIVHRDVKPSNVLLDEDGRPLLGDFDVSRFVGSLQLTTTGEIIGTAAYLAPEQVRGAGAGPAADVYALGLVLLECLTGHPVYGGTNQISIATARLLREAEVPVGLPGELRAVLAAMVVPDAERRPDAAACAEWLAAVAGGVADGDAAATVPLRFAVAAPSGDPARTRPPRRFRHLAAAMVRGSYRPAVALCGLALVAVTAAAGALPVTLGSGQAPAEPLPSTGGATSPQRPSSPSPKVSPTRRPSAQPSAPSPTVSPVRHRSVVTSTMPASTRAHREGHGRRPPPHHRQHGHGPDKPPGRHRDGGGHGPKASPPPAPRSPASSSPASSPPASSPAPSATAPPSTQL